MLTRFQIDLLFGSNTLWVWDTEKKFQELKLEHSELVHGVDHHKLSKQVEHINEKVDEKGDATTKDPVV